MCCINDDMQTVIGKMLEADIAVCRFLCTTFECAGNTKELMIDRQLPMEPAVYES